MTRTRIALLLLACSAAFAGDWLTFGHDPQRTGWAVEEARISPETVSQMKLSWKTKVANEPYSLYALTVPLVASGISTTKGVRSVVYVAGVTGKVFALDAQTGEELWNHTFKYTISPINAKDGGFRYQGGMLCPNGITATPVIDKGTNTIYVVAGDGTLWGLDLGSGTVRYGPSQFVAPFSKNLSLNLVDGVIYTTLAQGCGGALSGTISIDVRERLQPIIHQMLTSTTTAGGSWGRGGAVVGTNGRVYMSTADGDFNLQTGEYSNAILSASQKDLKWLDYYLPLNWRYIRQHDFDLGAANPVFFGWKNRHLLVHGAKESVINLMDADNLGGADHQTPLYTTARFGNDAQSCCNGLGIWGGLTVARDLEGQTWVLAPVGGPPAKDGPTFPLKNGEVTHGFVASFRVVADSKTGNPMLEPAWLSGDFDMPDGVVVANGVVFALSTGSNESQRGGDVVRMSTNHPAVLKALDLKSGKELYTSGDAIASWMHFSGLAISDGAVFLTDHDSNVYSIALPPGGRGGGRRGPGTVIPAGAPPGRGGAGRGQQP